MDLNGTRINEVFWKRRNSQVGFRPYP